MFCPHCGTKNEDDARFCVNCGKTLLGESTNHVVTDHSSASNFYGEMGPSSYQQLGGWLAVLTYGILVAVAIIVLGAISGAFVLVRYSRYLGAGLLFLGLLDIALYIPVVYFCLKMYRMIKERNCLFLRFYEMTFLILFGVDIILMVIGSVNGYISPSDHFKSLIQSVIVFAIWMAYFTKSVRVRTYFGSDKYLEQSIVLKLLKQHTT